MESSVLELSNLIQGFKLSCQTEGKSPKTVEWYTSFLLRFLRFLEQNDLPTQLNQIAKAHIRQFILYLQQEARTPHTNKTLSASTVQGYVRTLKAFSSWAIREDYIPTNHFGRITVPKAQSKIINTFSTEQVKQLVSLCQMSNKNGQRNLTILLLLLDTGLRVSELVNIDLDDVKLEEGSIKIRVAKGGWERIVPIGSLVQKALWKYIHTGRPKPLTQQITKLFLSDKGLPLMRNGIQQLLRRYGRKAGFTSVPSAK